MGYTFALSICTTGGSLPTPPRRTASRPRFNRGQWVRVRQGAHSGRSGLVTSVGAELVYVDFNDDTGMWGFFPADLDRDRW